mmetsp:Transcript_15558/g.35357  ORF Transcript_15558/g.35357 Transcript_15558/m.35357 type:complete len:232 (+) Transcript_15558:999-1694(+)
MGGIDRAHLVEMQGPPQPNCNARPDVAGSLIAHHTSAMRLEGDVRVPLLGDPAAVWMRVPQAHGDARAVAADDHADAVRRKTWQATLPQLSETLFTFDPYQVAHLDWRLCHRRSVAGRGEVPQAAGPLPAVNAEHIHRQVISAAADHTPLQGAKVGSRAGTDSSSLAMPFDAGPRAGQQVGRGCRLQALAGHPDISVAWEVHGGRLAFHSSDTTQGPRQQACRGAGGMARS